MPVINTTLAHTHANAFGLPAEVQMLQCHPSVVQILDCLEVLNTYS